jgi:hypothetical protein
MSSEKTIRFSFAAAAAKKPPSDEGGGKNRGFFPEGEIGKTSVRTVGADIIRPKKASLV